MFQFDVSVDREPATIPLAPRKYVLVLSCVVILFIWKPQYVHFARWYTLGAQPGSHGKEVSKGVHLPFLRCLPQIVSDRPFLSSTLFDSNFCVLWPAYRDETPTG